MKERVLVATPAEIICFVDEGTSVTSSAGLEEQRPTALTADPWVAGRAWCCTRKGGVFRSDDGGATWHASGLEAENLMTITASPAKADQIWVGGEPSAVWRSDDAGAHWQGSADLAELPSSSQWAFPPRPNTHHVRWIAGHPTDASRLWIAIEAGALISTGNGGEAWSDRVAGGPYDTHELAVHAQAPDVLRVAAGDGYFESHDGGATWRSPADGLDVRYLRSIAIDPGNPEVVVVSAASHPHSAYLAHRSDGRLFRREGGGAWKRVTEGWPDPPNTIAPLLVAGRSSGEFWAADERGVHRSLDGGVRWEQRAAFEVAPNHLRGVAIV